MSNQDVPMKFEDLILEDTPGILRPHPLTLVDLCGMASKIQQSPNDSPAPQNLPYPGEFVLEELADLYMDASKVHARLNEVKHNAVVTNNPAAVAQLEKVIVSLNSVKKLCKVMSKQLDSLTVDKLTPKE